MGTDRLLADHKYSWTLRALDLATGSVVWDERIGAGGVNALAGVGSRVLAAGFLHRMRDLADFTVRAYETSDH
jgi:hypothetical protein